MKQKTLFIRDLYIAWCILLSLFTYSRQYHCFLSFFLSLSFSLLIFLSLFLSSYILLFWNRCSFDYNEHNHALQMNRTKYTNSFVYYLCCYVLMLTPSLCAMVQQLFLKVTRRPIKSMLEASRQTSKSIEMVTLQNEAE